MTSPSRFTDTELVICPQQQASGAVSARKSFAKVGPLGAEFSVAGEVLVVFVAGVAKAAIEIGVGVVVHANAATLARVVFAFPLPHLAIQTAPVIFALARVSAERFRVGNCDLLLLQVFAGFLSFRPAKFLRRQAGFPSAGIIDLLAGVARCPVFASAFEAEWFIVALFVVSALGAVLARASGAVSLGARRALVHVVLTKPSGPKYVTFAIVIAGSGVEAHVIFASILTRVRIGATLIHWGVAPFFVFLRFVRVVFSIVISYVVRVADASEVDVIFSIHEAFFTVRDVRR